MADQKITELPIKTSTGINLSDYLLGIDSAEGYQMLVSDIAKKIVEDYAGSTLAGNARSIASAIDTSFSLYGGIALTASDNLDEIITPGAYIIPTTSIGNNMGGVKPHSSPTGYIRVMKIRANASTVLQVFQDYDTTSTYYRLYSSNSSTWGAWEQEPTRKEVNGMYSLSEGPRPEISIDWNTLTTAGVYFFNSTPTGDNKPIADSGKLIVERRLYNVRDVRQTFYPSTQSNGLFFVRTGSTNGTWEAWERITSDTLTTATITPSTGFESAGFNTFSITQCGRLVVINGYISNLTGLSTSASTEIATFSNVSLPTAAVRANAIYSVQAYEAGKNAYISFGNNGKIQVRLGEEVTNGKVLYLSASYLV